MKYADLNEFLYRHKLAAPSEKPLWTRLPGGVSSDIWRVELPGRAFCVKRALAELKVAADWSAPVERNKYEWEWFKFVHRRFPENVPEPIAHDPEMQMLALEFLADLPLWKTELLNGEADTSFAARVGTILCRIHASSAGVEKVRGTFATDKLFYALRIEPYLLATARKHPDLAPLLKAAARKTLAIKTALVHGDISPKNIMKGRAGQPVFLDAETAWYGDPAFDLAFCLNHLLLKCAFRPVSAAGYIACFESLRAGYLAEVCWEPAGHIEQRAARLLPMLFLARVDGKSPVEYLSEERIKDLIRRTAGKFIRKPVGSLLEIARFWERVVVAVR